MEAAGTEEGKDRFACQDIGDVGVLGETIALLGGSVSQDKVRRQLARRMENDVDEIGS